MHKSKSRFSHTVYFIILQMKNSRYQSSLFVKTLNCTGIPDCSRHQEETLSKETFNDKHNAKYHEHHLFCIKTFNYTICRDTNKSCNKNTREIYWISTTTSVFVFDYTRLYYFNKSYSGNNYIVMWLGVPVEILPGVLTRYGYATE